MEQELLTKLERLQDDPTFITSMESAESSEDVLAALAAHGITLPEEQLQSLLRNVMFPRTETDELDEEHLEAVSGGGTANFWFTMFHRFSSGGRSSGSGGGHRF